MNISELKRGCSESVDPCCMDAVVSGIRHKGPTALVITDHFTRFAQVYGTKSKSSKAAADKLYNEFVMQFGLPERIHTDQGGEFNSRLMKELHRIARIKSSRTSPYHPEGDGQTERFNRTLCNML